MEITLQWFAGFVDGEGSIVFRTYTRKDDGHIRFVINLSVSNTHLPTLQAIQSKFGGCLCKANKKRPEKSNVRQAYLLSWASAQAVSLLEAIHPYMVTKKEQVDILLAAWEPKKCGNGRCLTTETIEKRMQAISDMQELRKMEYLQ